MIDRATADVRSYRHEESEVFGCSQELRPQEFLGAVIRQAVIRRLSGARN